MAEIPDGYRRLAGSERKARRGAARVGPADPNETVAISIYVRQRTGAPPLATLASYVAGGQHEILSRAELAARHGASAEDLKLVTDFAEAAKLTVVHKDAGRRVVQVSGTVARVSKAFAVELGVYRSEKESYRGREGAIHLPNEIAAAVEGVFGLDNRRMARRMGGGTPGSGATPAPLTPPQVAKAYNFPAPAQGAAGQTIALLEFSGPKAVNPTCGFAQSDIDGYIKYLNGANGTLKSTNVRAVTVMGSSGNVSGEGDAEVALDIEVAVSVAQNAEVVVYFAPMTEVGWVEALSLVVHDAINNPNVLSISWGWPELEADASQDAPWPFQWTQQAFNQMTGSLQAAAAVGLTVLASSGDHGSDCEEQDGSAHVIYPATDAGVIACGGTVINGLTPLAEDTWNDFHGATGGGISYLVGPQLFQANAKVPVSVNPDHHQGRGIPDVAGNSSPASGYILWLHGQAENVTTAGTSAVAPLYAALVALINAGLNRNAGYLNPALYRLGGSAVFRDINDGTSNAVAPAPGYKSGPGWDACTGWGSVDGNALLAALRVGISGPDGLPGGKKPFPTS